MRFRNCQGVSDLTLSDEEFGAMFRDYKRSAFRMETHQIYTMPREQENLERFLAGKQKLPGYGQAWHDLIRSNIADGKTMQRVKWVRRPFTDYTRYLMSWGVVANAEVGEHYRILDITERTPGIPEQDYWIFDEETVVLLNFNPDGTLIDHQLADPADLKEYQRRREVVLPEAVPLVEYRAQ